MQWLHKQAPAEANLLELLYIISVSQTCWVMLTSLVTLLLHCSSLWKTDLTREHVTFLKHLSVCTFDWESCLRCFRLNFESNAGPSGSFAHPCNEQFWVWKRYYLSCCYADKQTCDAVPVLCQVFSEAAPSKPHSYLSIVLSVFCWQTPRHVPGTKKKKKKYLQETEMRVDDVKCQAPFQEKSYADDKLPDNTNRRACFCFVFQRQKANNVSTVIKDIFKLLI